MFGFLQLLKATDNLSSSPRLCVRLQMEADKKHSTWHTVGTQETRGRPFFLRAKNQKQTRALSF